MHVFESMLNHVQKINKIAGGQIFRTHSSSVVLSMRVKMLLHFLALYPQVIFIVRVLS